MQLASTRRFLSVCLALLAFAAPSAGAQEIEESPRPEHHAADPSAPEVTTKNLLASERFWPYLVALGSSWKGKGVEGELPAGTRGVLIRVEADGKRARIDFGRHGIGEVPIGATDLVARANEVRLGTLAKQLPNFVEAMGPRLLRSDGEILAPLSPLESLPRPGFLCVFADPSAPGFDALAKALAPLADRRDVMTLLFPQGRPADAAVRETLRALEWKVPFVFQHLSEPYTRTLIGDAAELPFVSLQTREGRLLLAKPWTPALADEVRAAIDAAFPES